jgi:hypothetical protein
MDFIEALDSFSKENHGIQLGQNKHFEYSWSTRDIQEQITQFFFQLVRANSEKTDTLRMKFIEILKFLSQSEGDVNTTKYISIIVRLLCHTRDIVGGKGEYALSYMMLCTLYDYFPQFAIYTLEKFVLIDEKQPYGSWKDMKNIVHIVDGDTRLRHPITQKCVELVNKQLTKDLACEKDADLSLCAKWIPRETSKKHNWFFKILAQDFFKESIYMKSAKTDYSKTKSEKKCYMEYRKLISGLNRRLDTVQIKQCGNIWHEIDHNKTTSITLNKNKKAFLNVKKYGEQRSMEVHRIECANNFREYIANQVKSGKEVKGKNVGLDNFTKNALEIIANKGFDTVEADLLNSQWRSNSTINSSLGKMVAMVDTSGSMIGDPLNAAIALGIRVAEKSILGKRVLTFSQVPDWHNLDGNDDFVSMVKKLTKAEWSMNTNFYAAMELILQALVANKVPPEEASDMILAVFSDMQIDVAGGSSTSNVMMDGIEEMYKQAGYTRPHILFWNLSSTSGFPTLSSKRGVSMMSGFSPALLNLFCDKGMGVLESLVPWNMMVEMLNNERYMEIDKYVNEHYSNKSS